MSDGRSRAMWHHTAELLSLIANTNRDPEKKKTPFHPFDFHPFAEQEGWKKPVEQQPKTKDLSILKVFIPK